MNLRETEISNKPVFKGRLIGLNVEAVSLSSGKTATRGIIKHPDASIAVAINDGKKTFLIEQRWESIKRLALGIPVGLVNETDASPLDTMRRELNGEGGYKAGYWEKVGEFYTSVGFYDEKVHLFYCDTLSEIKHKRPFDGDGFLTQEWYSLPEVKQLIVSDKVMDAKTVMAITFWKNMVLTGNQSSG